MTNQLKNLFNSYVSEFAMLIIVCCMIGSTLPLRWPVVLTLSPHIPFLIHTSSQIIRRMDRYRCSLSSDWRDSSFRMAYLGYIHPDFKKESKGYVNEVHADCRNMQQDTDALLGIPRKRVIPRCNPICPIVRMGRISPDYGYQRNKH